MMKVHFIELTSDEAEDIIVEDLKATLENVTNKKLIKALKRVIAFYSVPGTYEDGKYDLDGYV